MDKPSGQKNSRFLGPPTPVRETSPTQNPGASRPSRTKYNPSPSRSGQQEVETKKKKKRLKSAVEPPPTVSGTAEVQAVWSWKTTAVSQPCCSIGSPSSPASPLVSISAPQRLFRAPAGPGPSPSSVWHCSRTGSGP